MYGMYGDAVAYPFDQPTSSDGDTEEDEGAEADVDHPAVFFIKPPAAQSEVVSEDYIENYRL
jgi:hypothetical protein